MQVQSPPTILELMKKNAKRSLCSSVSLPEAVSVVCPGHPDEKLLSLLFTADFKESVCVRLDRETLATVVQSLHNSELSSQKYARREPQTRVTFPWKEVRYNYVRKCPYIAYRDEDGNWRTKHQSLHRSSNADDADKLQEAAEQLHNDYARLHHPDEAPAEVATETEQEAKEAEAT